MNKKRSVSSAWAEDASTRYNPDAPAVKSKDKRERNVRRYLWFMFWFGFPICVIAAIYSAATPKNFTSDVAATVSVQSNQAPGKSAALTAVNTWLNQTPSPLPGGHVLSWNGYTVENPPADSHGVNKITYQFERHFFTLQRDSVLYQSSVEVAVDGVQVKVTSTPTLTPLVDVQITGSVVPWFGYKTTTASAAVSDAVKVWAEAFTSGDPDTLRRAVQDKNQDDVFVPLSGVSKVDNTTIIAAGVKDTTGNEEGGAPATILVRATVIFWWNGQDAPTTIAGVSSGKKPAPITYDLLVEDANTATPYVVAWGGPGDGPDLAPYSNAITDVNVGKQPTPSPTQGVTGG